MAKLSGKEWRNLDAALRDAFTQIEFRSLLQFELELSLDNISSTAGDYRSRMFEVITYTESRNLTLDLISAAWNTNRRNEKLLLVAQHHGVAIHTPTKRNLEKILSQDNIIFDIATFRTTVGQIEGRVCRVEKNNAPQGTGFLIAPDVVLTNNHVVAEVVADSQKLSQWGFRFDYKIMEDGTTRNPGVSYKATEIIAARPHSAVDTVGEPKPGVPADDDLDFALVRLEEAPGDETLGKGAQSPLRGFVELPTSADNPDFSSNLVLFIPQHPQGNPMKLTVNTFRSWNQNETRMTYLNDTSPGSSGSPIFNGNWQLVGLHHSGDPQFGQPEYNEGIPINKIVSYLDAQELLDEILPDE